VVLFGGGALWWLGGSGAATPTNDAMSCPTKKKYFHAREEAATWQNKTKLLGGTFAK